MFQEVSIVLDNNTKQTIDIDDINKMTYLEQCIREALRLFPPGPLILRRATDEIVLSKFLML